MVVLLKDDENRNPSKRKSFVSEIAATIEKDLSSHWTALPISYWYREMVSR